MEPDHNPPGGVNGSVAVFQKVRLSSSPQPALTEEHSGACHVFSKSFKASWYTMPFDPV